MDLLEVRLEKCDSSETNKNMDRCVQPLNTASKPLIDVR